VIGMAEKKITKKDNFKEIVKVASELGRTDLVEFAEKEIALLEKKASSKAPTKTQIANEGFKTEIVNTLVELGKASTIAEIQNANTELSVANGVSNQKISALLTQLKNEGKVVRTENKGKAYFTVA